MPNKVKIKYFVEAMAVVLLFLFFSFVAQKYVDNIRQVISPDFSGMVIYTFIVVVSIVFAPISSLPLMPLASTLWGVFISALLSIIGWTIGALIAFIVARKIGFPIIRRLFSLKKIYAIERKIPRQNLFLSVIFLRMSIPVDILSYALGLFTEMSLWQYILATIIGVTPFAFIFAYAGKMPLFYQLLALVIAGIIVLIRFGKK